MRTGIYPGSFDPVTLGHFDIIERSSKIFDRLIVGVLQNSSKSPLFSTEERVNMLRKVTEGFDNVEIMSFNGLLVDFVRANEASVVVRGLRAITDFEYELQMAQMNRVIAPEVDTMFLTTNLKYSYLVQHRQGGRPVRRGYFFLLASAGGGGSAEEVRHAEHR